MRGLRAFIPGTPHAQGRPRAVMLPGAKAPRLLDPKGSRKWKKYAAVVIAGAARAAVWNPELSPLAVHVRAFWPALKASKAGTPALWKKTRPDADNVLKAVLDAGDGLLWSDDGQVARMTVEKFYAAKEDDARVEVFVSLIEEDPPGAEPVLF